MNFWLWGTSSFQSAPRTENSMGKPRWAVKPCCDVSWMTARRPGTALSSRRNTAENSAWSIFRWPGGTRVRNIMPEFTPPPPPMPPTKLNVWMTSG